MSFEPTHQRKYDLEDGCLAKHKDIRAIVVVDKMRWDSAYACWIADTHYYDGATPPVGFYAAVLQRICWECHRPRSAHAADGACLFSSGRFR